MSKAAESTSSSPSAAAKRPPRRRWIWRIAWLLLIICVLVFVVGQIIFSTDMLRGIAVRALEKSLDLRVSANSFSTGWSGHSTLHDVTFSLPLADNSFITIPELELGHTPLPVYLATDSFDVNDITLQNPTLDVRQTAANGWNFLEVIQLMARSLGGNPAAQTSQKNEIPVIPNVHVINGTVVLHDDKNRTVTIEHLSIDGTAQGALVWQYHAAVPGQMDINGKIALGGSWYHEFDIQAHDIKSWLAPWVASWPQSAQLQAHWSGKIENGHLAGRIDIGSASYGNYSLTGPADIVAFNGPTIISPAGISFFNSPNLSTPLVRFDAGQLSVGDGIESRQLLIACANGHVSLDGQFAFGRPNFNAVIDGRGSVKAGQWNAHATLNGSGVNYDSLSMTLATPTLRFDLNNGKTIDLSGLSTEIDSYSGGLTLQSLRLGDLNTILSHGGYDFSHHLAWLSLDGRDISLANSPTNSLNFDLNIWANSRRVHLQQLFLQSGSLSADLFGEYLFNQAKPFKAHLGIWQTPTTAAAGFASQSFRGRLQSGIDLEGTVNPLDLNVVGFADGSDIYAGQRYIGDTRLNVTGQIRDGQVTLVSNNIELFGGIWSISGTWPVQNGLFHLDNLSVQHLDLAQALASTDITGTLDGEFSVDVRSFTTSGIQVDGDSTISNFVVKNSPYFTIDQIQMPVQIADGYISLYPFSLTRKTSTASAQAQAGLWTTVEHPDQLTLFLSADSWPLENPHRPAAGLLGAQGSLYFDFSHKPAVIGHLDLSADAAWKSKPVGSLHSAVDFEGRRLIAHDIQIKALQGSASGSALYDVDNFAQNRMKLQWQDLDLSNLAQIWPNLSELHGKINGSLDLTAATTPRPLEPLAIDMRISSNAVKLGKYAIGDSRISAYLGPNRIVLDESPQRPSTVQIFGGVVGLWGRISKPTDGLYESLLELNLENIDLDAIIPAGAKSNSVPGILSGRITIVGRPGNPKLAFGQGNLTLYHSDLASTGPIAYLYDLMHITHDPKKPVGGGTIDFTIQSSNAYITALRYFDRGSEVRMSGNIDSLTQAPHCPINLVAVGSVKPFTSIDIPGLADIDQALDAVERDAISIQIYGYLDAPQHKSIGFSEIGQEMRNILFSDVKAANY